MLQSVAICYRGAPKQHPCCKQLQFVAICCKTLKILKFVCPKSLLPNPCSRRDGAAPVAKAQDLEFPQDRRLIAISRTIQGRSSNRSPLAPAVRDRAIRLAQGHSCLSTHLRRSTRLKTWSRREPKSPLRARTLQSCCSPFGIASGLRSLGPDREPLPTHS